MSKKIKNDKEQALILTLLKNSLLEVKQTPEELCAVDYEVVEDLINDQMVAPTVYKELLALGDGNGIPEQVLSRAKETVTQSMAIHSHIRQKLRELEELFSEKGIDLLLLKGFAIDKSPLRRMSDLDVLIDEKNIDRAFEVLEAEGYRYVGSFVLSDKELSNPKGQYRWNNQYQFHVPNSPLVVEVHTNLFERGRIRTEKLSGLLDRVELFWEKKQWDQELHCHIPAKEASLALLCMHSAIKYTPAVKLFRLRQSYDIVKLLRNGIDEQYFFSLCHRWKIEYYIFFSLKLAALVFRDARSEQLAKKIEPALRPSQSFLARTHMRAYRGFKETSFPSRMLYGMCMPFIIGGGFRKALRWYKEWFFPPVYIQERKYGIRRTSPIIYLTYMYGPARKVLATMVKGVIRVFN